MVVGLAFLFRAENRITYLYASDVHNGSNDVVIGGGRVISLVAVAPVTKPTGGDLAQIVHGVFQHGCTLKVDVDEVFLLQRNESW